VRLYRHRPRAEDGGGERGGLVASPLAGTLAKVEVTAGQHVAKGELLAVVEAMKMETSLLAPFSGTVVGVRSAVGGPVAAGQVVVEVDAGGSP
jgi:biotin carboxyl carrier protein